MAYNLMTCSGFGQEIFGGCTMAWLGLVLLFFIAVFLRVLLQDMGGMEFNQLFAIIIGIVGYLVLITIFGSVKWAMLAGIIGSVAGGFIFSMFGGEY